mgnify:CR=1 FL=1
MNNIDFVFFHVGDITQPQLLTLSIKKFNPESKIYFITDLSTKDIEGVTKTVRLDLDSENLMISRLEGFSKLELNKPAVYIDTDVLVVKPIPISLFEGKDIILCNRSFSNDALINTSFRGMDLSEFAGRTLGEVYPFLACFTYSKNYKFWHDYSR